MNKKILWESSLSRIKDHISQHDTGFITAFRSTIEKNGKQVKLTREENLKRNQLLKAILTKKYNLTLVQGKYIENYGAPEAKEVGENTFFVVDFEDTGELKKDLLELGQQLQQDSILFIPKGGQEGFIIGTSEGTWPGLGSEERLNNPIFGKSGQFMTKIHGRPFIFTPGLTENFDKNYPLGYFGEFGRYSFIENELARNKK